ncbi:MAG TPA: hypothetical protein VHM70_07280 [Polyangiaceae bacterium]|nr:hypothetical protein [Polyangiaceae bacterium]
MKRRIALFSFLSCLSADLLVASEGYAVGTRRIALRDSEDFSAGKLEGVAVDSAGRVRASFNLGSIAVEGATNTWAALHTKGGSVLIATGNEGRVFELNAGSVKEIGKVDGLAATSLVEAWDGSVIIGSLPHGKLYEYKAGKFSEWTAIPDAQHILQLAFDAQNQVLYAATGPEGKLYRITRDKKAQVYLDVDEEHLTSVAVANGKVFVGGGDKAKLYAVDAPGRASVLYDFGRTEVRAIVAGKAGDIYAIANELSSKASLPSGTKNDNDSAGPGGSSAKTKGKGTLYHFDKNGVPEQLLDDTSEHYTSLALDDQGSPYVGTGSEGKVYTVDSNRNSVLVADTQERQVPALLLNGKDRSLISSDPVVVHPVRGVGGADSTWTSAVIDAGLRAHFGRLDWAAEGKVEIATRSGNAAEPDDTWSQWSAPLTQPGEIQSPPARFFQVRARFNQDANAVLSEVSIPFITDNLRATISSVQFENSSSKAMAKPSAKLIASGGPISERPDEDISITWKVDNPDKDDLRYWLKYKREGTSEWFDILDPNEKLTKTSYSWDTADLPEGRYRVRVIVSDVLSNSPDRALQHQLDSYVVFVDNTPPEVRGLKVDGHMLSGTATDGIGPIARIEVAVAGSDEWYSVTPADGVLDEPSEEFRLDLTPLAVPPHALLTVRVFDEEYNRVVASTVAR